MATANSIIDENPAEVVNCLYCNKPVEILNFDVQFSIDLHMQTHKSLEELSLNMESQYFHEEISQNHSAYACPDCGESVNIFNNDVKLSLQLHAEKHRPHSAETKSNNGGSIASSCQSKSSKTNVNSLINQSTTSAAADKSESIIDIIFDKFQPELKAHRGFITESESGSPFCKICSLYMSKLSKISEHLRTKSHEDKTIMYVKDKLPSGLEGAMEFISFNCSNLYCNLCSCRIDLCSYNPYETIVNIFNHNKKAQHSEESIEDKSASNYEEALDILNFFSDISPSIKENKHFIVYSMQPQFKCTLCKKFISIDDGDENVTLQNLNTHMRSDEHLKCLEAMSVLNSYKTNNSCEPHDLTILKGSIFCSSCESFIQPNLENIIQHVKGSVESYRELSSSSSYEVSTKDLKAHVQNSKNSLESHSDFSSPTNKNQSVDSQPSCSTFESEVSSAVALKDIVTSLPEIAPEIDEISKYSIENEDKTVNCSICNHTLQTTVNAVCNHLKESNNLSKITPLNLKPEENLKLNQSQGKIDVLTKLPDSYKKDYLCEIGEGKIKCLACQCLLSANTYNLQQHLEGNNHKCNEKLFKKKQIEQETVNEGRQNVKLNYLLKSLPLPFQKVSYVVENTAGQVTCLICNCIVPRTTYNLTTHLTGNKHTQNEKSSGVSVSNPSISHNPLVTNLQSPALPTVKCQSELKENDDLDKLKQTDYNIKSVSKYLVKSNGSYICKVCSGNIEVFSAKKSLKERIVSHFYDRAHNRTALLTRQEEIAKKVISTNAIAKFNSNYLKMKDKSLVCTLCNQCITVSCDIDNATKNIVGHLNGKKHLSNIKMVTSSSSGLPKNTVAKDVEGESLNICEEDFSMTNVDSLLGKIEKKLSWPVQQK